VLRRVQGAGRKIWATNARERAVADPVGGGGLGLGDADLTTLLVTGIAIGGVADDVESERRATDGRHARSE
jgi:hypothetical protein